MDAAVDTLECGNEKKREAEKEQVSQAKGGRKKKKERVSGMSKYDIQVRRTTVKCGAVGV